MEVSDGNVTAEQFKEMGNQLFQCKNPVAALDAYTQAITMDPSNHIYYSNRSMCNAALRDYVGALADATKCVEINPTFMKGFFRQASAQLQLGLLDAAEEAISRGVALEGLAPDKSEFSRLTRSLIGKRTSQIPEHQAKQQITAKEFTMGDEIGVGNFTQVVELLPELHVKHMKSVSALHCDAPPPLSLSLCLSACPSDRPRDSQGHWRHFCVEGHSKDRSRPHEKATSQHSQRD